MSKTIHKKLTYKEEIGLFIQKLREKRGLTQDDLAKMMDTSQSAIARLEKGLQNLTVETLEKLSSSLQHKILHLKQGNDFVIQGNHKLSGEIQINASKNGAMGLLCASLINLGTTILYDIPRIEEVNRILEVLESIGVKIKWLETNTLLLQRPKDINLKNINIKSANQTRTILMFMGVLSHFFTKFKLPNSQGCKLGKRTISAHSFGLEKMGIQLEVTNDSYILDTTNFDKNSDIDIVMYETSDTATENLLICASLRSGKTTLKFASINYMVQDVIGFLQKIGCKIKIIGTNIQIQGLNKTPNQEIEYYNSPDPIEAMMFLTAGICTNSTIKLLGCPIDFLELELLKLEKMGFIYEKSPVYKAKNGFTNLVDITTNYTHDKIKKINLKSLPDKISCGPYPNINMDNLPFFVPIACLAEGNTLIHDWPYENRAIYFTELTRLGANIQLLDPHRLIIFGKKDFKFKPSEIVCPPALRPSMIILLAMLSANDTSILRNVYSIKRGYEEIATRLNTLGAKIEVI